MGMAGLLKDAIKVWFKLVVSSSRSLTVYRNMFGENRNSLAELYRQDDRPWLVGFSGGKDSTMVASLVVDAVLAVPAEARKRRRAFNSPS
jgi:NH3-dependent NAD+ synthetase